MKSHLRRGVARMAYCMAAMLAALLLPCSVAAQEETAWMEYDSATKTLTFKYGEKPSSFGEGVTAFDMGETSYTPVWNEGDQTVKTSVEKAVFDKTYYYATPSTCNGWFSGMTSLTTVEGLQYLDTYRATDMSGMFSGCTSLVSIDLSSLDTYSATDMSDMFSGCTSLVSIDLSPLNMTSVTDMSGMFSGCTNLASITFPYAMKTGSGCSMSGMFKDCTALTSLDMSAVYTESVTDMSGMFSGCTNLKTIYAASKFVIADGVTSDGMFTGCTSLPSFDSSKTDATMANSNGGYFTLAKEMWAELDSEKTLTFMYGTKPGSKDGVTLYDLNGNNSDPEWYGDDIEITKAVFDESFDEARPTVCRNWFSQKRNLTEIVDIKYLHTDNVTNMNSMFSECNSLESLDVSGFNTENVTDMGSMFSNCSKLTYLDVSKFNTAKVTDMCEMFSGCEALERLEVSGFNTENVTSMSFMFYNNTHLTSLDVSNFNTANVTDMENMFSGCEALTSLDVSKFNTAKVENMYSMFDYCKAVTTLDVSSFNTANVTDMRMMFDGCTALKTIYGNQFDINTEAETDDMFRDCSSLEGAAKYDENNTGASMANYKTGYFKTYCRVGDTKYDMCGETLSVDKLELEDGKDFVAHAPFTANNASYSRTMAGNYGTLCLPFDVETASNADSKFYGIESVDNDVITLNQFDGTIAAGTPVFVYSTNGLNISASNVDVLTAPAEGAQASGWQLVGSFTETTVPNDGYIISKNKFWLTSELTANTSVKAVKTKGLRAWLKAGSGASEARATSLSIFAEEDMDEETAIDAVEALTEGTAEIYDVQGRRTDRLQKGLNIVKTNSVTKKIMVK